MKRTISYENIILVIASRAVQLLLQSAGPLPAFVGGKNTSATHKAATLAEDHI
jgi:hypothetical protein